MSSVLTPLPMTTVHFLVVHCYNLFVMFISTPSDLTLGSDRNTPRLIKVLGPLEKTSKFCSHVSVLGRVCILLRQCMIFDVASYIRSNQILEFRMLPIRASDAAPPVVILGNLFMLIFF